MYPYQTSVYDPYGLSESVLNQESALANIEQELQFIKEQAKKEEIDPYKDLYKQVQSALTAPKPLQPTHVFTVTPDEELEL